MHAASSGHAGRAALGLAIPLVLGISLGLGIGFVLTAALPLRASDAVPEPARSLHERILTLDSHLDTPAQFDDPEWDILEHHAHGSGDSQVDYPRMVEGGLDGGVWVVYTPQRGRTLADDRAARDHALKRLIGITNLLATHPDKFELALTPEDARRIEKAGRRVVFISIENASPLTTDPSLLQFYYDQGLRMLGLVHFRNNEFADSATDQPEWRGLSPRGRELVAEANRLGILLDQSHSSDEVFDQLLELSKAPIVLSHSGARAVFDHPRNIDDARIRRLAAKGGVIQVNSYGAYLKDTGETDAYRRELRALDERLSSVRPGSAEDGALSRERTALTARYNIQPATIEDFFRHLKHILDVAGPDHVGFGADWDGGGGVVGLEDVTSLPKITAWLQQQGYSEQQIANIWSGNLLRVIGEAQRAGRELSGAQTPAIRATPDVAG